MPINTDFTVHADSKPQILRLIIRNHILLLKAAMPMYIHEHEEWCLILIQVDTFMSNNKMCFDYGKEEKSSKNK